MTLEVSMIEWSPMVHAFFRDHLGFHQARRKYVQEVQARLEAGLDREDYRVFHIEQYPGKRRLIEAPEYGLRRIQQALLHRFWYRVGAAKQAHGFVTGRSPVTNAQVHAKQSPAVVMRVDVKDFFHAIDRGKVHNAAWMIAGRRFHLRYGVRRDVVRVITELCCRKNRLPMGSPCSPAISNIVMASFDRSMTQYCAKWGWTYTRYADDIMVSGPRVSGAFPRIEEFLIQRGFKVHPRKTKVMRKHRQQKITGVVVNSGNTTVSRKERRRLRAQMFHTEMHWLQKVRGTEENIVTMKTRPVPIEVLAGKASWVASVNPGDTHQEFRLQIPELLRLRSSVDRGRAE